MDYGDANPESPASILDHVMDDTEVLMQSNLNSILWSDFEEITHEVQIIRDLIDEPAESRGKREAVSVDCTALPTLLAETQQNISVTEEKIRNSTSILNFLTDRINFYQSQADHLIAIDADALKMVELYQNLAKAIIIILNGLKTKLLVLQANEAQINSEILIYCSFTTTQEPRPDNVCGELFQINFWNQKFRF